MICYYCGHGNHEIPDPYHGTRGGCDCPCHGNEPSPTRWRRAEVLMDGLAVSIMKHRTMLTILGAMANGFIFIYANWMVCIVAVMAQLIAWAIGAKERL